MRKLRPLLFLLAAAYSGWLHAAGAGVWVALSEGNPDYAETAEAIRMQLLQVDAEKPDVTIKPWREFSASTPSAKVIVTVGTSAFAGVAEAFATGKLAKVPIVATLLPRAAFETLRKRNGINATAVVLDQPLSRQMALLRYAFPTLRKVGVLLGPDSKSLSTSLERAAEEQGLQLVQYRVEGEDGLYPALQRLLDESEVLLALPDPLVFNGSSIQNILLASYRQKIPMAGFSPGYVRAGAILALYSAPAQIGAQTAKMVRDVLAGQNPAPQAPQDFNVGINLNVARSLGYRLNEESLKLQLRGNKEAQP